MAALTIAEAAARLGLAPSTLRAQIANGRLKATKVGPVWTVSERELARYQRENAGRPGRPPRRRRKRSSA
jgi:excisionase family DNA binding protein